MIELDECLTSTAHTAGACLLLFDSGAIQYKCHHNTCSGKTWQNVKPRLFPDGRYGNNGARRNGTHAAVATTTDYPRHFTDYGNALRLVEACGDSIRYCYEWKRWLVYDGQRWNGDDRGAIIQKAKHCVRQMYFEASQVADDATRKNLVDWARKSENRGRLDAMIALTQDELPVKISQLDQNPWLLNAQNGTLDLRTGQLLPHNPDDLITKLAPVKYDPTAECSLWLKTLDRIFAGNQLLVDYVQRVLGYSLTGVASEQCYFILHGTGQNGKSTILETFSNILSGDGQEKEPYAMNTATETISQKRNSGAVPNDVARLKGARMVTVNEVESGTRLAENFVKQVTGGDTISARFLHAEWFDFKPEFKLFIRANNKPDIKSTDKATWRRPHLIPFTVQIPDDEVDHQLPARLKKEWPGILAWLVRGCLAWQRDGLNPPAEVLAATKEYREEMDTFGAWIAECCVEDGQETASELYASWKEWCVANGHEAGSSTSFGKQLRQRGCSDGRDNEGKRAWMGIRLRTQADNVSNVSNVSKEIETWKVYPGAPAGAEAPDSLEI